MELSGIALLNNKEHIYYSLHDERTQISIAEEQDSIIVAFCTEGSTSSQINNNKQQHAAAGVFTQSSRGRDCRAN
jgi:hypothetical protein